MTPSIFAYETSQSTKSKNSVRVEFISWIVMALSIDGKQCTTAFLEDQTDVAKCLTERYQLRCQWRRYAWHGKQAAGSCLIFSRQLKRSSSVSVSAGVRGCIPTRSIYFLNARFTLSIEDEWRRDNGVYWPIVGKFPCASWPRRGADVAIRHFAALPVHRIRVCFDSSLDFSLN